MNCGAIPEGTIDSELFGHEKGSFTGAVASRKGYFEEADGGTIFLDEVAELPLTTQARLLRVLESGEFLKVGSSTVQKTNIRVVAATNVDMVRAVEEGRFREDLFYRLSTVQITIPPLRERGGDIALLARKFATDFAERWHLPAITLGDDARMLMQRYRWPGNVRQLKNVIEQVALFEAGSTITADHLRTYLPDYITQAATALTTRPVHDYEQEREMWLNLILQLQSRIDRLEQQMGKPVEHRPGLLSAPKRLSTFADSDEGFTDYSEAPATERPAAPTVPAASQPTTLESRERQAIAEALARNGGRRNREPVAADCTEKNYCCDAYREFLGYATPRLMEVYQLLRRRAGL